MVPGWTELSGEALKTSAVCIHVLETEVMERLVEESSTELTWGFHWSVLKESHHHLRSGNSCTVVVAMSHAALCGGTQLFGGTLGVWSHNFLVMKKKVTKANIERSKTLFICR